MNDTAQLKPRQERTAHLSTHSVVYLKDVSKYMDKKYNVYLL